MCLLYMFTWLRLLCSYLYASGISQKKNLYASGLFIYLFIFCWIIAEDAAQVARQFLLRAVMRCLCPFLHRIPPPPILGMFHVLWHIDHLILFCFCDYELF
jgi:hypothetical protein